MATVVYGTAGSGDKEQQDQEATQQQEKETSD